MNVSLVFKEQQQTHIHTPQAAGLALRSGTLCWMLPMSCGRRRSAARRDRWLSRLPGGKGVADRVGVRQRDGLARPRCPEVHPRRRYDLDAGATSPGSGEAKPPRVQQGPAAAGPAEQRIALDRVADPGEVRPDLVPPAGDRADGEKRVLAVAPQPGERGPRRVNPDVAEHFLVRHRPAQAGFVEGDRGAVGGNPDPVLAADAERKIDRAALGQAGGASDREVDLADRAVVELAGQVAVEAQLLGQQQDTGSYLVDPVRWVEFLARIGGQADQIGVVPFSHHRQAGRLVQHEGGRVLEQAGLAPDLGPPVPRPTVSTWRWAAVAEWGVHLVGGGREAGGGDQ